MGKGGSIQKCIIDGLPWELSGDNDANVTIGGRYITEIQETTGKPYAVVDQISGSTKGLETRVGAKDGTFTNFDNTLKKCAKEDGVSAKLILADGASLTASGGAHIIATGAADGMMTTREGKLPFDIVPVKGKWIVN